MKIKLVVGDRVEFDVKFTLNDAGVEKPFGMRMAAERQPLDEQEREFSEQIKVKEYLEGRGLAMVRWIGPAPLVDEDTKAEIPAGPVALNALYAQIVGMVGLVYAKYQEANGVKGRSGN